MLYFFFECARAWEPDPTETRRGSGAGAAAASSGEAPAAALKKMRDAVTEARRNGQRAASSHAHSYLDKLVKPVYGCIKGEGKLHPDNPRNYDDWNEGFWRVENLSKLRTAPDDETGDGGGARILGAAPAERWPLLLQADWPRFFKQAPKTHRELRWWGCLLAANRRVFLLHAVLLGLVVIVCMPLQPEGSWDLSGWGALRIFPFLFTFAPLASVGGRSFEMWARPSARSRADFFSSVLMLLVIGTLAGYVVYQQIAMPYNEFEGSALSSAEAAPLLITSLALAVLGVWRMVAEFMPRAAGRRADPDAQLHYEKNTKALKHESFFTYEPLQGLVLPADRGNAGGASEKLPGTMRSLGTAPSMKAGDVEVESRRRRRLL